MRNGTFDDWVKAEPMGFYPPQVEPFVAQLAVADARFDRSGNADLISNSP